MTRMRGFTLIELMVVMAAMGLLLSLAAPRYLEHLDRSKETVLRHNLQAMRLAIDHFREDKGRYPRSLVELVQARYLRELPLDPLTDRTDSWRTLPPAALSGNASAEQGAAVADVRSAAPGEGRNGVPYAKW